MATQLTIDQLDEAAKRVFLEAAERFVHDNSADLIVFSKDQLVAILRQAVVDQMPGIPTLRPIASIAEIKNREDIIATRASITQVNAAAERQDQQRYQKLRTNAVAMAGTIAKSLLGLTLGLGVKALAGV